MSQFYARYVPPAAQVGSGSESSKRKLPKSQASVRSSKRVKVDKSKDVDSVLQKYSSSHTAENNDPSAVIKKRRSQQAPATGETVDSVNEERDAKHSAVLSRFDKSRDRVRKIAIRDGERKETLNEDVPEQERHGLEPIPQPATVEQPPFHPSFNVRPDWLNDPTRAERTSETALKSLQLNNTILENLHKHGTKLALPIQSAVLPMLLNTDVEHRPDICVSAATGSGKTLTYVIPILNDLQQRQATKLRAVIVAPTRTLVRQVAQVCESSSSGLGISIGTAEGSRALKEEQKSLIEEIKVYDPIAYNKQQQAAIDWSNFSLKETLERIKNKNLVDSIDFVTEYKSKIDLLVTTPGRLVEHLQSTKGFTLDDVEWFVVDEADRLLNESYHEWLEIVMPALKSQRATESRDRVLKQLRMSVPVRRVTKLLLSATMTRDISQLIHFDLKNPKLVIVESEMRSIESESTFSHNKASSSKDDNLNFQIPSGLHENVVPLKSQEGTEKPLFLLQILQKEVFATEQSIVTNGTAAVNASDTDTSDDTSSDESSESDTDSSSSATFSSSSSLSSTDSGSSSVEEDVEPTDHLLDRKPSLRKPSHSRQRALVFTRSTESAARLARLLSILAPNFADQIGTYTSSANSKTSARKTLTAFKNGKLNVLISTDLAGRGLDIEALEHVINYDVPANALTYVHRVGRTARAGMEGHAWTLLEYQQAKWFWEEIGGKNVKEPKISREDKIKRVEIKIDDDGLVQRYEGALQQLGEESKG